MNEWKSIVGRNPVLRILLFALAFLKGTRQDENARLLASPGVEAIPGFGCSFRADRQASRGDASTRRGGGCNSSISLQLLGREKSGSKRTAALCLLFYGLAFLIVPTASATGAGADQSAQPLLLAQAKGPSKESINVKLHDLELIDQDGNRVKFESEVIGDRVAVVIPFYTTCTTAYPILIYMFTRLQEILGPRLGKEVVLVSVSVDPRTDIPVRLKAFAKRQKAKPGWTFLSGERNNLGQVLWGVGVLFTSNLDEHNHIPITMVGSAGGEWRRFHGFPSPDQVMAQIEESLAAARAPSE